MLFLKTNLVEFKALLCKVVPFELPSHLSLKMCLELLFEMALKVCELFFRISLAGAINHLWGMALKSQPHSQKSFRIRPTRRKRGHYFFGKNWE